jgi:dihydroorotate dehydrogenase electron transfer subunit
MNYPKVIPINRVIKEARDVKTLLFDYPGSMQPGQFFMIWIPGIDEIPMSVSYILKETKGITFRRVGEATDELFRLNKGDMIGVRGPYGNGFTISGQHILFVGGGTGAAMLAPAVEEACKQQIGSTIILGFKTEKELFFEERLRKTGAEVHISTDDGTAGFHGYATELAGQFLQRHSFTSVLTCGPEVMMKQLHGLCESLPFQASLERYMKCGVGICSQCSIGHGLRVCVEGPVFDGDTLSTMGDFGVFKRDASGKKIPL